MLSHISASLPRSSLCATALTLRRSLLSSTTKSLTKFHFYPSNPFQSKSSFSVACDVVSKRTSATDIPSMDSPSMVNADSSSLADDFKKQSLDDNNGVVKLKLEELNWDHSFVLELPGDPRTDTIPRE
ncbi:unnamed protein product, partial [Ilex paraguariensis]